MSQYAYSAGSDSSDDSKSNYYDDAKKLVKRAGKLEKKKKLIKLKNFILKLLKNWKKHILQKKRIQIF